tara:strand:- start:7096 stop:7566 length:471 start_codon:yes stop_codon:yes gene_type:complete
MSFTKNKDSDNYATNKEGWLMIQEYIPKDKIIWSPFYCDGKQKEYFKEMGYDIIHEDKDFFSYTPAYDIIIDNPPFSKLKDICNKLKELDKPFLLICGSTLLLAKWFQKTFKDDLQVIIPFTRPTFTGNGSDKYTPPFGTMFYCYKMNLDKDLIFI